jgi:chemotaxis protein MotA
MTGLEHRSPHVAWLACLYSVLSKVRREGLMAIEMDVESPERKESIFSRYPLVMKQPYLDFARDILRLMLGGMLESKDLDLYSRAAIDGMSKRRFFRKADRSLLELIALTLRMAAVGYGPQVACEFGRQAIPAAKRPSFGALEELLKEQDGIRRSPGGEVRNFEEEVERFVQSLGS